MNSEHDLGFISPNKLNICATNRRSPGKLELLDARQFVHADNIDLVPEVVPQFVEFLHQPVVIRLDKHTTTPALARYVGDDGISAGSLPNSGVEAGKLGNAVSHSTPPVRGTRKGEWFRGRTLRTPIVFAIHGCRPVRKEDTVKDEGYAHVSAVVQIGGEFHRNRRERRAKDPLVHGSVIAPVPRVKMGKDEATRWR